MSVQSVSYAKPSFFTVHASHLYTRLLAAFGEWRTRHAIRRTFAGASERELRDAGLIRSDVEAACGSPLSHSAASELRAAARGRAGNW